MKNVFALAFFLLSLVAFSQSVVIRGLVKDAVTNEPIIAASIGVKNSGLGTISNEEGNFQLTAPKSVDILITYLGYKTATIPATEFTEATKTILLEQSEEVLEEVMVVNIPLHIYLRDIIAVSKARFNKPILLHTYYREFVKSNNKYVKFSDGLLDYHISGSTKKTKSDVVIKQNRSFLLIDEEEDEGSNSFQDLQKVISRSYEFAYFTERLLDEKHYEDYDFELKSKKDKSGNELHTISFEPKTEVEKALHKGTITFDPKTKLICEVETTLAPSHMKYLRTINLLIAKISVLDSKYKASFKMVNSNYFMNYSNRYSKARIWNKKHDYLEESRSDLVVTDFEKDDLNFNKKEVYNKKRLFDKPTHYTEKFWQKNNAIVLTAEEEEIIASLEKEVAATPKSE